MVTLRANRQEGAHQNQQQVHRQSSREQRVNERVATVADDDNRWNLQRNLLDIEGRERNDGITDDWRVKNRLEVATLGNNNQKQDKGKDISLGRELLTVSRDCAIVWRDVSGSVSTQCSDVEDDDDEEIRNEQGNDLHRERSENLGLAEEEEEAEKYEDDENEGDIENGDDWIRRKVVTTRVEREASFDDSNGQAVQQVMPNLDEASFGDVNVTNSKHVHVGNTNFYKGPVTIKQFVYTNAYPIQDKTVEGITNGIDDVRNGRISDINPNDVPHVKGDPNRPILLTYGDYDRVTKWLWTWRCAAILCVLALSSVTIVVVVSVILTNNNGGSGGSGVPDSPTSGIDPDDVLVDSVRFIERDMWNAQPPSAPLKNLTEVPTPYVIISHTVSTPCKTQSECVLRVRLTQTLHIESFGWSDIAYNFLVGGDGLAYVGRGWDAEGAHAFGWNSKSIGISFIGTFNDVPPYKRQLFAAIKVIEVGVKLGKISPSYKLLGHRQVSETLSPGDKLYEILKTWKHWSPIPRPIKTSRANTINQPAKPFLVFLSCILLILLSLS